MSYLEIQLLLVPLTVAALAHLYQRQGLDLRRWCGGIALLSVIATVWTTPWDNWMVLTGVWGYPPSAVVGTVGYIPIEEQAFFVLQTVLTGAWFGVVYRPGRRPSGDDPGERWLFAALGVMSVLIGVWFYVDGFRYLGSLLAWFGVPLALQLAWGADQLLARSSELALAIVPPTVVLCIVDVLAIQQGTWFFDESVLKGAYVGALPIEEVIFFLFTNALIVFGLALWYDLRIPRLARR